MYEIIITNVHGRSVRKKISNEEYEKLFPPLPPKPPTKKQIEYAKAIAETLKINLPDIEDFFEYHNFISRNKGRYNQIRYIPYIEIDNEEEKYEQKHIAALVELAEKELDPALKEFIS